jgi:hemerythrin
MPGETAEQVSGWTIDTAMAHMQTQHNNLVALLNERALAQEVAMTAALASAKEAVAKAEVASDKRFASVNEFRQTLSDQTSTFATRVEHDTLTERINRVEARIDTRDGKGQGISAAWAVGIAALAGIIGVLGFGIAMIDMLNT